MNLARTGRLVEFFCELIARAGKVREFEQFRAIGLDCSARATGAPEPGCRATRLRD
jgi:hypothetical protein